MSRSLAACQGVILLVDANQVTYNLLSVDIACHCISVLTSAWREFLYVHSFIFYPLTAPVLKLIIIIITRQVTCAPRLSLSRNAIMNFQTGKCYKTIRHC